MHAKKKGYSINDTFCRSSAHTGVEEIEIDGPTHTSTAAQGYVNRFVYTTTPLHV